MTERADLQALQAENARLVALLESHGIAWRCTSTAAAQQPTLTAPTPAPLPAPAAQALQATLSTAEKVALFRRLFRGRTDVYPVRWESKTSGKSGYAPACANEWRAGVCEKPRIKCGDCGHRLLVPLSDAVLYDHLAGKQTVGVYPLLEDDTCYFLAVDFDEAESEAGGWQHDAGVLCAPTAFGKTVTAAAIIARRGVNTLVLVHRTELLKQWQERLEAFLGLNKNNSKSVIGTIGGGKAKPTGHIDIAVMQSLSRQGEVNALVENYGQIVVDECHHVGATSFDAILKRSKAKFVLGLTATPIRRDGQQPIIFMQCGPIRHTAARPASAPHDLEVVPRSRFERIDLAATAGIQDVFRHLANDLARTQAIAAEAAAAFGQGRKVLVLTERTEHPDAILLALNAEVPPPFVLHGRMSKKQRAALITALDALPPDAPRILLASGKLVGEGFDHPRLDTLVLAMPVSWKGTLQQYAGRLHREHASKADVRIIDFVDTGHPALLRMWDKRQRGYRAMGYRMGVEINADEGGLTDALADQGASPGHSIQKDCMA
jgi:superfamily II DNA or RNA helicase